MYREPDFRTLEERRQEHMGPFGALIGLIVFLGLAGFFLYCAFRALFGH